MKQLFSLAWVLAVGCPLLAQVQLHPARVQRGDTVLHTYADGHVSVRILPWQEYTQQVILYAPDGTETHRFENSRMHLLSHTDLYFHPNGAVREAHTRSHPDAGIQRYSSTYTFDTRNRLLTETHEDENNLLRPTLRAPATPRPE
jgi:hypothetical protein